MQQTEESQRRGCTKELICMDTNNTAVKTWAKEGRMGGMEGGSGGVNKEN